MALVRGINTAEDDHGKGYYIMHTGRRPEPAMTYPHLGSVCAKLLGTAGNPLPGYIHITPRSGGGVAKQDAAFLGPRFAPVALGDGQAPANLRRPDDLTEAADRHAPGDARQGQRTLPRGRAAPPRPRPTRTPTTRPPS